MRSELNIDRTASVQVNEQDGVVILRLSGHVNEMAADAVSKQLDLVLDQQERTRIIFDLTNVVFMGSSVLGQIMRAYRAVKGKEGYVRIVNPQPLIADLFELTKLDRLLTIHPSVEDAMSPEQ